MLIQFLKKRLWDKCVYRPGDVIEVEDIPEWRHVLRHWSKTGVAQEVVEEVPPPAEFDPFQNPEDEPAAPTPPTKR